MSQAVSYCNSPKSPTPKAAPKSSNSPKAGSPHGNNGGSFGFGSNNMPFTPIRWEKDHNWTVLDNLVAEPTQSLLYVTDQNIHDGKPGMVGSCAVSQCAM